MAERFRRRVVVVIAGAGFGKSTLLAQAVAENRLAGAGRDVWLGLSEDHAAASVLVADLLGALESPQPLDLPTEPTPAARLVADAVWALAPAEVALVVDDVHLLPADSPGRRLLLALADVLPNNGHLVLAGRPPLPDGLSPHLANGAGLLLAEDDLAFAGEELARFAASRRVQSDLLDGVGGWPALAELVASTGRRQVVVDYLWQEVLRTLSPHRRRVLTVLAAVGGADDALVTELLGEPARLAEALDDLPLVSMSEGRWSLHPLWENALQAAPEDPRATAAVAAAPAALRRRGLLRQSMGLLVTAGAWDEVRSLAVEVCYGISPAVDTDVLDDWLRRLPESVRTSPGGLLLSGTAATGRDPWTARKQLEQAAEGFRLEDDRTGEMACLVTLFHIAFWHNELDEMLPIVRRWRVLADQGVPDATTAAALGRALLADNPAAARAELARLPVLRGGPLAVLVGWLRAHLLVLTLGEAQRAVSWAQQARPLAPASLRSAITCELVEALRLLGRVEEAMAEADTMLTEQDSAAVRSPRHLAVAVVLASFVGDHDRAAEHLDDLAAASETSPLPWAPLAADIGEAAFWAGQDDDRAAAVLRRIGGHPLGLPLVLLRISPAALMLQYVLDPSSRPTWNDLDLFGVLARTRRLARAVAALREGAEDVREELQDDDLEDVVGLLPIGWLVLVAVSVAEHDRERGRDRATRLVQRLGPSSRPALRRIEESGGESATVARRLLSVVPSTPQHTLRIDVLGPLRVYRDGVEVDDPNSRRARVRQLLGYLAVHRQASRQELTARLWPDLSEADAARNLRVTLNYLQRVLEPSRDERDAPFFLRARASQLELVDDVALEVDLRGLERDLAEAERAEAQGTPSLALAAYLRAVEQDGGELLADQDGDDVWLDPARERVQRRCLRALLRAGQLVLASGDHVTAEDLARRALTADRFSEEAYRILVAALAGQGEHAAAQRALDRMFAMLEELQVPASPASFDLARQLRASGAGVHSPHPSGH